MKKFIFLSLAVAIIASGCSFPKNTKQAKALTPEEAKTRVTDFINKNLMQAGSEVSIKEVSEENGMYKIIVNVSEGQEITSYLTKDGKKFFPQVMDIDEVAAQNANKKSADAGEVEAPKDIPKTDKPEAELYVMSFCPYGVQAEDAMLPVFDLLKGKADIKIRFIASIEGDDINKVKSLHGPIEGIEDARQLCVAKNYDAETLWKYVSEINKNCYPIYRNGDEVYKECREKAAKTAKVDVKKIEKCVTDEGPALIRAEDEAAGAKGVSGSPTIFINGAKYSGGRTAEAFKQAICSGFNTQPEECVKVLESTGAAASGGCE